MTKCPQTIRRLNHSTGASSVRFNFAYLSKVPGLMTCTCAGILCIFPYKSQTCWVDSFFSYSAYAPKFPQLLRERKKPLPPLFSTATSECSFSQSLYHFLFCKAYTITTSATGLCGIWSTGYQPWRSLFSISSDGHAYS